MTNPKPGKGYTTDDEGKIIPTATLRKSNTGGRPRGRKAYLSFPLSHEVAETLRSDAEKKAKAVEMIESVFGQKLGNKHD